MGYQDLLIDFDDTIVDFYDPEEWAFYYMANVFNHKATKDDFLTFKKMDHQHWEAFRQINNKVCKVLSKQFVKYSNIIKWKLMGIVQMCYLEMD